jgi:subtilisin family serine protease
MTTPQQIPTGVQRIGAVGGTTAPGVKVAVIDTGIDDCHPDLRDNVKGGINVIDPTKSPRDDNGHGTHVAGIIAASDNGFGVVGVAPAASLYAVKVLNSRGSGSLSSVVTALDWAAQHGIQVANLSLGAVDAWCVYYGLCGLGAECSAITNALAAGVTVVVAAGNAKDDAAFYTPANCVDSVTATAHVDSDGAPGGAGPAFTIDGETEADDTFAQSFSNFSVFGWDIDGSGAIDSLDDHPIVDLTAPGVAILSTMPTYKVTLNTKYGLPRNYGVLTGTSMATPHASGAAARYLATHPGATPDAVRKGLVLGGECPAGGSPTWLICPTKWPDDPDAEAGSEPLVHAP